MGIVEDKVLGNYVLNDICVHSKVINYLRNVYRDIYEEKKEIELEENFKIEVISKVVNY